MGQGNCVWKVSRWGLFDSNKHEFRHFTSLKYFKKIVVVAPEFVFVAIKRLRDAGIQHFREVLANLYPLLCWRKCNLHLVNLWKYVKQTRPDKVTITVRNIEKKHFTQMLICIWYWGNSNRFSYPWVIYKDMVAEMKGAMHRRSALAIGAQL